MAGDWRRESRTDPYKRAARKRGYRARSAYKLKQIQARHHVMKKGDTVVDLGAAPGGWSQVAKELVGEEGIVIAADLAPIRPLEGIKTIKGDITKDETVAKILEILADATGEPDPRIGCVISDMSPKLSGTYDMDQARSAWLAEHALGFAERTLRPGGNFVVKVFEGQDFIELRETLKQRFSNVRTFHPAASRKSSSEVYVVAKGYRGEGAAAGGAD
jgi:23S rRNA (uridine2552-2'-O)-methyltransferase